MLEKLPESLGRALANQRAGLENIVVNRLHALRDVPWIEVSSGVIENDGPIPSLYTADGAGISPPIQWRGAPDDSASVAFIVEDGDAPTPHPLVHAIVVNLAGDFGFLAEGALNSPDHKGIGFEAGRNSFFQQAWLPPDPPPGHGIHRYAFQFFALRAGAPFSNVPGREEFIEVVLDRAIAAGCLIGTYERVERDRTRIYETEIADDAESSLAPARSPIEGYS
jgi:Raf kinase inhibitor-like YbhB/YbcL family protein